MFRAHLLGISAVVLAAFLAILGCRRSVTPVEDEPTDAPWFEDMTDQVGLDFVHDPGPIDGKFFLPQITGCGAALFDFDGDGLLDVYLLNNGGPTGRPNQLYRQLPSGRFVNVSANSGLDFSGNCLGVAVGDFNNDGRPDVLVTLYDGVRLFRNDGGGKFTDVTAQSGLKNPLWGTSAAFVDSNRDGWLDLVVVNYVDYDREAHCADTAGKRDYCSPKPFPGTVSKLFRNRGRDAAKGGPLFEDVSLESGIGRKAGPGLGVVAADFNGDGWPDIFITNDGAPNHLWINQKDGTFKEEAAVCGLAVNAMAQPEANMGIGWGDVDGDGLQDVFVTHLDSETNTLWKQGPPGIFHDATGQSGLNRGRWRGTGFGTWLADFDHDGSLDAVVVNGRVRRAAILPGADLGEFWNPYGDRNQLFVNTGGGKFTDHSRSEKALCSRANIARGLAVGDVRNDGHLWLLVSCVGDRARLFRANPPHLGHWLVLRLLDKNKRDALGAEIVVRAGNRRWIRTVQSSASYLSSNDPRAHVGLGTADRYDALLVSWPDGSKEEFPGGAVDRHVEVVAGRGRPVR
jgi:hypothetical protein